jgi:hypothetical protein
VIASLLIAAAEAAQDEAPTGAIVGAAFVVVALLCVAWARWLGRERKD